MTGYLDVTWQLHAGKRLDEAEPGHAVAPAASRQALPFDQMGLPRVVSYHWVPAPTAEADGRDAVAPPDP